LERKEAEAMLGAPLFRDGARQALVSKKGPVRGDRRAFRREHRKPVRTVETQKSHVRTGHQRQQENASLLAVQRINHPRCVVFQDLAGCGRVGQSDARLHRRRTGAFISAFVWNLFSLSRGGKTLTRRRLMAAALDQKQTSIFYVLTVNF
jgi:hypothetical protein